MIFAYTTVFMYGRLNRWMRQGIHSSKTAPIAALLNRGLSKLDSISHNKTYYRGLQFRDPGVVKAFLQTHKAGATVTYNAFTSAASHSEPPDSFFGQLECNVKIALWPKPDSRGKDIHDLSFGKLLAQGTTSEALFMTDSKFKILAVDERHTANEESAARSYTLNLMEQ